MFAMSECHNDVDEKTTACVHWTMVNVWIYRCGNG